jgi:hypothetical protein
VPAHTFCPVSGHPQVCAVHPGRRTLAQACAAVRRGTPCAATAGSQPHLASARGLFVGPGRPPRRQRIGIGSGSHRISAIFDGDSRAAHGTGHGTHAPVEGPLS